MSKRTERLLSILSPIGMLILWEAAVRLGLLDARFFPTPSSVLASLFAMAQSGTLWVDLKVSLGRILAGFLLGGIPGIILGIAMGLNRWVRAIFNPVVAALYPIPKTAILPLVMLIFGIGEASKIVLVAISVFFVLLINAMAGVIQIDPIYLDVGRNLKITRLQFFRTIALPGSLPVILAGIKLGLGISLIVIVSAEMLAANAGIGFMIWQSWQLLEVERMYAGLLVISALGLIFSWTLDEIERFVIPWKQGR